MKALYCTQLTGDDENEGLWGMVEFRFATRKEMQSEDLWDSLQSPDDSEDDDDKVSYKRPPRGEMQAGT